jgi:Fe2+ or Zn2+ uptake regulation protein
MGMYDYIKDFEIDCPKCGNRVAEFQTKEGERLLDNLEFWQVNNFYALCDNCNEFIEFSLKDEAIEKIENLRKSFTIDDYNLEVMD